MAQDDDILASYELDVDLDHFQFFLEACDLDWGTINLDALYEPDAHARHLGVAPGLLSIHTARYGGAARLELIERRTVPHDDVAAWDNVVEVSFEPTSDCLSVERSAESEDPSPFTFQLSGPPGIYRVRVYTGGIKTVIDFDGYEGQDHYRAVFWPAPYAVPVLLRSAVYP